MTAEMLLGSLEAVRSRGAGKWSARCPAHTDKSPSLSVTEGDKGLLLKCWAGCSLDAITGALHLSVQDLFFDALTADPHYRRAAMEQRAQERAARQAAKEAEGWRLDAFREAEALIQSAQGLTIDGWSDDQLNAALDRIGAAYQLLESEPYE